MSLDDYLALIPAPNRTQPKFMAWLSSNLQPYIDAQNVLTALITAFNIDSAVGEQLDILGQILKLSRTVNFEPSGGVDPVLDDDNYRLVLKAKIIQNQWKGTKPEIYAFWNQFFPGNPIIVTDNGDMSIDVIAIGMDTFQQELVENFYFFPKPAGVLVNFLFPTDPLFAYGYDNDYLKGYNEGYWADPS